MAYTVAFFINLLGSFHRCLGRINIHSIRPLHFETLNSIGNDVRTFIAEPERSLTHISAEDEMSRSSLPVL